MKVYLARHGQTNYNVLDICNYEPSVDVHLTEHGLEQIAELADRLRDAEFTHAFVSELRRTQQTADIINKTHQVPVSIDSRLNDNRNGYEGKPTADFYAAWNASTDKWNVRFNDGESIEDVKKRVNEFISELKSSGHQSVLVVTSMVIVQTFNGIINNLSNEDAWEFPVSPGSCIELELI